MSKKIYVGVKGNYDVFRSETEPSFSSHGNRYTYVIGPFRTMRAARFMARFGKGNPNCTCVSEAEHLASLGGENVAG